MIRENVGFDFFFLFQWEWAFIQNKAIVEQDNAKIGV